MDLGNIIGELITALFVAIPTSVIAARLAIKQYRSERWWDKRLASYLDAIAAINNLILYCDGFIDVKYNEISIPKQKIKSLEQGFHDARLVIQGQVNIGKIMYSQGAYRAIFDLNNKMFISEREEDDCLRAAKIRDIAEECANIFTEEAKKDLIVSPFLGVVRGFCCTTVHRGVMQ